MPHPARGGRNDAEPDVTFVAPFLLDGYVIASLRSGGDNGNGNGNEPSLSSAFHSVLRGMMRGGRFRMIQDNTGDSKYIVDGERLLLQHFQQK
jgi:hypothetical protein